MLNQKLRLKIMIFVMLYLMILMKKNQIWMIIIINKILKQKKIMKKQLNDQVIQNQVEPKQMLIKMINQTQMIKELKFLQIIQFINNSENLIDEIKNKKMRILLKIIMILIIIKLKKKNSIKKMIK